jgi:hypothetical protein
MVILAVGQWVDFYSEAMIDPSCTQAVRERIRSCFVQLGARADQPMDETILVRAGYFCGHRFQCDGLVAVWFIEENQIKFYDREGKLAAVRTACESSRPVLVRAA